MLGINIFYRWKNDDAGWLSKSTLILWPSMQELVARLGSFFCGNMVKVHLHVFEAWALCAQLAWCVLITFALFSEFEVMCTKHTELLSCLGLIFSYRWKNDDAGWLSKSTLILWPSMQELVARLGSFFCGNMVKVHLHVFEAWALCAQLAWRVLITFALLSEFEVHFECVGMVVCNHWSSAKIKLILLLH